MATGSKTAHWSVVSESEIQSGHYNHGKKLEAKKGVEDHVRPRLLSICLEISSGQVPLMTTSLLRISCLLKPKIITGKVMVRL
jgi:hypothetical protein